MKTLLKIFLASIIASSALQGASKWIDPTRKNCTSNGGEMSADGVCKATWANANRICDSIDAELPDIIMLRAIVVKCGGTLNDYNNNRNDSAYQSCYKNKGFSPIEDYYWSNSTDASGYINVWGVNFNFGYDGVNNKNNNYFVRCIKE